MSTEKHDPRLRIRENFKLINKRNPVSGHEWLEYGSTTSYSVVGPTGELGQFRTEASAQRSVKEWEEYYNKFGWPFEQIVGEA